MFWPEENAGHFRLADTLHSFIAHLSGFHNRDCVRGHPSLVHSSASLSFSCHGGDDNWVCENTASLHNAAQRPQITQDNGRGVRNGSWCPKPIPPRPRGFRIVLRAVDARSERGRETMHRERRRQICPPLLPTGSWPNLGGSSPSIKSLKTGRIQILVVKNVWAILKIYASLRGGGLMVNMHLDKFWVHVQRLLRHEGPPKSEIRPQSSLPGFIHFPWKAPLIFVPCKHKKIHLQAQWKAAEDSGTAWYASWIFALRIVFLKLFSTVECSVFFRQTVPEYCRVVSVFNPRIFLVLKAFVLMQLLTGIVRTNGNVPLLHISEQARK